eukprot:TRINITY_DN27131_c0_g1_i1.p1 TRINITY_DN27131_c0_g1~~TRINITY_DN27131_c0_g1_i1.p1  ORF type:complete len:475 (+),score=151.01 TRINITY_DN27131_c0_g1_i1:131-1555(+)
MSEDRDEARQQQRAQLKRFLEFTRLLPPKRRYRIDIDEAAHLLKESKTLQERAGGDLAGGASDAYASASASAIESMGIRDLRELHTRTLELNELTNGTQDAFSTLTSLPGLGVRGFEGLDDNDSFTAKRLTPIIDFEDAVGMDALAMDWERPPQLASPMSPLAAGAGYTPRTSVHAGGSPSTPGRRPPPSPPHLAGRRPVERSRVYTSPVAPTPTAMTPAVASAGGWDRESIDAAGTSAPGTPRPCARGDSPPPADPSAAGKRHSAYKVKVRDTSGDFEKAKNERAVRTDGIIRRVAALVCPVEEPRSSAVCTGLNGGATTAPTGVSLLGFSEASTRTHKGSPHASPRELRADQHPLYTSKPPPMVPELQHNTTPRPVARPKARGSYAPHHPTLRPLSHKTAIRSKRAKGAIPGAVGLGLGEALPAKAVPLQKRTQLTAKMVSAWLPNSCGGKFPAKQQGPLPARADAYKLFPR